MGTKDDPWYRITTSVRAMHEIYTMPKERFEKFLASYEMFEQDKFVGAPGEMELVKNYYGVLNHLCSVGNFEKMYLPPYIDASKDTYGNQLLYEKQMADELEIGAGHRALDIGCGRGRVANHVARYTGAHVTGINVDPVQIGLARDYAEDTGLLGKQLEFKVHDYNDPLPFPDGHFDAVYYVQVLSYHTNLTAFFSEVYRVVKPGGKVAFEDYVLGTEFDGANSHHRSLLSKYKPVLGGVQTEHPLVFKAAVEAAGFKVLTHGDRSIGGRQYQLLEQEKQFFIPLTYLTQFMAMLGVVPDHLRLAMERMTEGTDAVIEADKLGLVSCGYVTTAQRPL